MVSVGLSAVGRGNDLEKTARFIQILQQALGLRYGPVHQ